MSTTISTNATSTALPYPIPERWIIAPRNGTQFVQEQCPSHTATLLTFLATNVLTGLFSLPLGCRMVVEWLTRKKFGKRYRKEVGGPGDRTRAYMWLLPFCTQLLSNLFVAILIRKTPGYGHTSIGDIMLLYLFRPRFGWILLSIVNRFTGFEHGKRSLVRRKGWSISIDTDEVEGPRGVDIERPWNNARISNCVAEILLQFMAMIYVETTWNNSHHQKALPLTIMIIFAYPWPILVLWVLGGDAMWPVAFINYGISWAFFTVMVLNAGTFWCPPKLVAHAAIWTAHGSLASLLGAG